jgi:hypothetical protein
VGLPRIRQLEQAIRVSRRHLSKMEKVQTQHVCQTLGGVNDEGGFISFATVGHGS